MYQKQIEKICKDELFLKKIIEMEIPTDIQNLLCEKGITVSLEEAKSIKEALNGLKSNGDLSIEDLELVSGGMSGSTAFNLGQAIGTAIGNVINNIRGK